MNKIPSVNLADFLSDDVSKKQQFVSKIGQAYENIGFVALKGHFLDDALVDKLYTQIKNFCGFKAIFNNVTVTSDVSNDWIIGLTETLENTITIPTIDNESSAHLQIFH